MDLIHRFLGRRPFQLLAEIGKPAANRARVEIFVGNIRRRRVGEGLDIDLLEGACAGFEYSAAASTEEGCRFHWLLSIAQSLMPLLGRHVRRSKDNEARFEPTLPCAPTSRIGTQSPRLREISGVWHCANRCGALGCGG